MSNHARILLQHVAVIYRTNVHKEKQMKELLKGLKVLLIQAVELIDKHFEPEKKDEATEAKPEDPPTEDETKDESKDEAKDKAEAPDKDKKEVKKLTE